MSFGTHIYGKIRAVKAESLFDGGKGDRSIVNKEGRAARSLAQQSINGPVPFSPSGAAARYASIVESLDDATIARIANESGLPENVIRSVKSHLFETVYEVAIGPNTIRVGKFAPYNEIAEVWESALNGQGIDPLKRLVGHEYLEHTLMKHLDLPYVPSDPAYWNAYPKLHPTHFGAHDLSPNPWNGKLSDAQMKLWETFLHAQ